MASEVVYKEDLDNGVCQGRNVADTEFPQAPALTPKCHPGGAFNVKYVALSGTLILSCGTCNRHALEIAIAKNEISTSHSC